MIENKTEINLLNDAMFKALFRSKEARGVIASVISIILGIDKNKLIYADYQAGELVKNKLFEKGKTCDIIIKIDDGNKIILEMNQIDTKTIFDKNATYSFTIINESIRNNEETPIVDYIKQKGNLNMNLKIKYFIIAGSTCIFIILLIILNVKKNKFIYEGNMRNEKFNQ